MEADIHHILVLAFHRLQAFSIPQVGTFRRAYLPAMADPGGKTLEPPGESVVLDKGDAYPNALENFIVQDLKLSRQDALTIVGTLGRTMKAALEQSGKFSIPGVGEIVQESPGEISFSGKKFQSGDYFGLPSLQVRQPVVRNESRKENAGREESPQLILDESQPSRKFVKVPIPDDNGPDKTRYFIPVVIGALLLIAMIGAYRYSDIVSRLFSGSHTSRTDSTIASAVQPEKKDADTGRTAPSQVTETPAVKQPLPEEKKNTDSEQPAKVNPPDANAKVNPPDQVPPPVPRNVTPPPAQKKSPDGVSPYQKRVPAVEDAPHTDVGMVPKPGEFYLIASSHATGAEAQEKLKTMNQGKYTLRIIAPYGGKNLYKISVYNSSKKPEVIQKMVQWKNDFPEKSWIYYIGM